MTQEEIEDVGFFLSIVVTIAAIVLFIKFFLPTQSIPTMQLGDGVVRYYSCLYLPDGQVFFEMSGVTSSEAAKESCDKATAEQETYQNQQDKIHKQWCVAHAATTMSLQDYEDCQDL